MKRTIALLIFAVHFSTHAEDAPKIGELARRSGDEIMVCGQLFHTTTPVVLWMDSGGYDAYRVENALPFFATHLGTNPSRSWTAPTDTTFARTDLPANRSKLFAAAAGR